MVKLILYFYLQAYNQWKRYFYLLGTKKYLILSANPASINDYSGMQDVGLNKKIAGIAQIEPAGRARLPRHQSFVRSARFYFIIIIIIIVQALHLIPLLFSLHVFVSQKYIKPLHKSSSG